MLRERVELVGAGLYVALHRGRLREEPQQVRGQKNTCRVSLKQIFKLVVAFRFSYVILLTQVTGLQLI